MKFQTFLDEPPENRALIVDSAILAIAESLGEIVSELRLHRVSGPPPKKPKAPSANGLDLTKPPRSMTRKEHRKKPNLKNAYVRWTQGEKDYVAAHYKTFTGREIGEVLSRPAIAVNSMAGALGVTKFKRVPN